MSNRAGEQNAENKSYSAALKAKARMTKEDMHNLHTLLTKYEENLFRRRRAGDADKVGYVRACVREDVTALSQDSISTEDKRRILQDY
jgi:hypothetical protein